MISKISLEKLEYVKILEYISNYASTELGKNDIQAITPFSNVKDAEKVGVYVQEAKDILIDAEYPPINFLPDLHEVLSQSNIEGTILRKESIKKILELSEISRKLYSFLKSNSPESRLFGDCSDDFFIDKNFESYISRVFNPAGEIKDNASKKLSEIRRDIIKSGANLKRMIEKLLKGFSSSYLVQEEYVTQRDGRLVLPVKAEHKRHVKGFIHSESSTGQTVYIEPEETLELNNEILSLGFAEKREIERILKELTVLVGSHSLKLKSALNIITRLDVIFAKAKYSMEIIGSFPQFSENKKISLLEARHPLLLKKIGRKNTVPLNFEYTDNCVTLITGPNAGGKTVVLKTIGLLTLLAQSGIHIPAHPDSVLFFFNNIMLDIGDEQSIEDDLSTFSSHLSNIKYIIENSDNSSLILIDEIGTGTDPSEGTALATAFLITLMKKESTVIATTHHGNLKIIASELPGFQNASMEFDLDNLRPTYKFKQGSPGSSYAFEVAQKIGLKNDILNLAEEYLDSDKSKVEKFIIDLENKSSILNKKLKELEIENSRLKGLTNLYEKEIKKLNDQKKQILKDTKDKADNMLKDINSQFENTIKRIKETKAERDVILKEKKKINDIKENIKTNYQEEESEQPSKEDFRIYDYVQIKDSLTKGEIVELDVQKGNVTIDTGSLRIKAKIKNLLHSSRPKQTVYADKYSPIISLESSKLDIRGRKPEEIEFEVVKFIDDAQLAGLKKVEIIHGKGTGILRATVHKLLEQHVLVQSFDTASVEYGGAGATIVDLK